MADDGNDHANWDWRRRSQAEQTRVNTDVARQLSELRLEAETEESRRAEAEETSRLARADIVEESSRNLEGMRQQLHDVRSFAAAFVCLFGFCADV